MTFLLSRAPCLGRFGHRPKRVAVDGAYGSATLLAFVLNQGALPHVPVSGRSRLTKGKFTRQAFTYDPQWD